MKFRIVRDFYAGYEVQAKRWWWPFWVQCSRCGYCTNTHATVEDAREFARQKANHIVEIVNLGERA